MVNPWTQKSIDIANAPGYLDAIMAVYPLQTNSARAISSEIASQLKQSFCTRDSETLVRLLIKHAKVFPVKDSYVGFLRKKASAIEENPKTIQRIASRIYALPSFEDVLREAQRPAETNRQLGNSFRIWLKERNGYAVVSAEELLASTNGIKLLRGDDAALREFAETHLGCILHKGIDFVIKVNKKYVIGEAKFLSTPGGEQGGGFRDAYGVVSEKSGEAIRVAAIDGYVWLPKNRRVSKKGKAKKSIHEIIVESELPIMSALVLPNFLKSLE